MKKVLLLTFVITIAGCATNAPKSDLGFNFKKAKDDFQPDARIPIQVHRIPISADGMAELEVASEVSPVLIDENTASREYGLVKCQDDDGDLAWGGRGFYTELSDRLSVGQKVRPQLVMVYNYGRLISKLSFEVEPVASKQQAAK